MTPRERIKAALLKLEREARLDTGGGMGNPEGAMNDVETAIDALVLAERINAMQGYRPSFAMTALQGILASEIDVTWDGGHEAAVEEAVRVADLLIARLELKP